MKKRLKDVTHDPYDYPDDEVYTKEVMLSTGAAFIIGMATILACTGVVWLLCTVADYIKK